MRRLPDGESLRGSYALTLLPLDAKSSCARGAHCILYMGLNWTGAACASLAVSSVRCLFPFERVAKWLESTRHWDILTIRDPRISQRPSYISFHLHRQSGKLYDSASDLVYIIIICKLYKVENNFIDPSRS